MMHGQKNIKLYLLQVWNSMYFPFKQTFLGMFPGYLIDLVLFLKSKESFDIIVLIFRDMLLALPFFMLSTWRLEMHNIQAERLICGMNGVVFLCVCVGGRACVHCSHRAAEAGDVREGNIVGCVPCRPNFLKVIKWEIHACFPVTQ